MNVTIKINETTCRAARHRAVDAGLSLSGWISGLIQKELRQGQAPGGEKSMLDLLGNDRLADAELAFPRDKSGPRTVDFS